MLLAEFKGGFKVSPYYLLVGCHEDLASQIESVCSIKSPIITRRLERERTDVDHTYYSSLQTGHTWTWLHESYHSREKQHTREMLSTGCFPPWQFKLLISYVFEVVHQDIIKLSLLTIYKLVGVVKSSTQWLIVNYTHNACILKCSNLWALTLKYCSKSLILREVSMCTSYHVH